MLTERSNHCELEEGIEVISSIARLLYVLFFSSPKSRNINWELGEFLRSEHFWVLLENSEYLSPSVSGTICFLCLTHPSYWTSYGQLSRTQKPFNCFSFIITASPSISPFHIFQRFFLFETQPWHLPFSYKLPAAAREKWIVLPSKNLKIPFQKNYYCYTSTVLQLL